MSADEERNDEMKKNIEFLIQWVSMATKPLFMWVIVQRQQIIATAGTREEVNELARANNEFIVAEDCLCLPCRDIQKVAMEINYQHYNIIAAGIPAALEGSWIIIQNGKTYGLGETRDQAYENAYQDPNYDRRADRFAFRLPNSKPI